MIVLARHGETDDNRPPLRFQGWTDTPLNDTGRAQARELAALLAAGRDGGKSPRTPLHSPAEPAETFPHPGELAIASLWSSDLSRARETAEIVGARLGLEPRLDPRLREGARGDWEGRLFDDVAAAEPERYAAWRRAGAGFRFPGGESLAEHQARVLAALAEIEQIGPAPALVVCHGGSIRAWLCHGDPRGLDAFHTFEVPNVALVEVPDGEVAQR